jgi:hypothetical protein
MESTQLDFSEIAVLNRVLQAERPAYSPELAKEILSLDFSSADKYRMNQLAALAREGGLSAAEQAELDGFERVGHIINVLQSRARRSLKLARGGTGELETR